MAIEIFCYLHGILAVTFHPETECFNSLNNDPRIVRRDTCSQVAKRNGQTSELESKGGKCFGKIMSPAKTAIGCIGFIIKRMFSRSPVEASLVDNNATKTRTVSTDPLGERRNDNIGTIVKRATQVWRRKCGINNQGQTQCMSFFGNNLQVANLQGGVGTRFAEKSTRLVVGHCSKAFGIFGIHKPHFNTQGRKNVVELSVCATVESIRANNVISSLSQVDNGVKHRTRTGGKSQTRERMTSFQLSIPAFQDMGGRVH
mmetsp:Transcript_15370/g.27884  ORF Transcript_15370/g.27884 Transcript_15370/m.27884 type:complete len:258 (+) Transcript_15370:571-1344(+)